MPLADAVSASIEKVRPLLIERDRIDDQELIHYFIVVVLVVQIVA